MSQFKPKKLNIDAIHAGQKYPEARTPFLPSDLNEIIEVIYGESIGVENSAKRAFLLTKSNALIDISIKNKQVIFPNGTHIFGDDFLDNFSSIKYVPIPEDVMVVKEAIVVYNRVSKSISIFDHYYSGENYEYLYLFSFNFASEVLTDLPIPHLVNGVKTEQGGVVNAHIPTKLVYSLGEDYINIDTSNHFITFPIDTTFGEHDVSDTDNETERTIYYTLVAEGKEELALVYDSGDEALKFVSNFDIVLNQSYEWLFTMYFDNGTFVYCDLEAPFYVNGALGGDEPTVEIVQTTGESTTAVMSQSAVTEALAGKLNTISYTPTTNRVPTIQQNSGKQDWAELTSTTTTAWSVCQRNGNGATAVGNPQSENQAVPLGFADGRYVQTASGTAEYPRLYEYSQNGYNQMRILQTTWRDDETALIAYSAVQRDDKGRVQVGSPIKGIDAANRSYVDAVYRHEITLSGNFDYSGTKGYMACTVYSRKSDEWDYTGYNCTLTGRTTATGIINIDGTAYTIVGVDKNANDGYGIYYVSADATASKFYFMDGDYFTFTDTVTKMI